MQSKVIFKNIIKQVMKRARLQNEMKMFYIKPLIDYSVRLWTCEKE